MQRQQQHSGGDSAVAWRRRQRRWRWHGYSGGSATKAGATWQQGEQGGGNNVGQRVVAVKQDRGNGSAAEVAAARQRWRGHGSTAEALWRRRWQRGSRVGQTAVALAGRVFDQQSSAVHKRKCAEAGT